MKMCTKRKYNSQLVAELTITRIRAGKRRPLVGKQESRIYKCEGGGTEHWHLTSQREDSHAK